MCSAATHFSLTIRPTIPLDDHAHDVLSRLAVDLEYSKMTNQWPGTMLLDQHARVNTYMVTDRSVAVLRDEADSLYE